MNNYTFSDVSHHKGALDFQAFADLGHRLMIAKASDNYNLPDKNGVYHWNPQRHYDSRFVDNYIGARSVGMLAAGYHFARFDRPQGVSLAEIIQKNLDYYLEALDMLPDEYNDRVVGIIDIEQSASQLQAAGLGKSAVSDLSVMMVEKFKAEFVRLIFYSGSWWTDEWLTQEASTEIAKMVTGWEAEYPFGMLASDGHSVAAWRSNYLPSVTYGFTQEFVTTADNTVGKLFAHQFSEQGRVPPNTSNIDMNRFEISKEELYKFFDQDGAVDPPGEVDLSGLEEDHDEIMLSLDVIEELLIDLETNLASHHIEVMEQLDGGTQPPEPPPSDTVDVQTTTEKNRIYLSYSRGNNDNDVPKMEFYPTDSAPASDRIFVVPGSFLRCFREPMKADGGRMFYKLADYDTPVYMSGSKSRIPADFSPDNDDPTKALFVEFKFLK